MSTKLLIAKIAKYYGKSPAEVFILMKLEFGDRQDKWPSDFDEIIAQLGEAPNIGEL
jgi:hypothetical protein